MKNNQSSQPGSNDVKSADFVVFRNGTHYFALCVTGVVCVIAQKNLTPVPLANDIVDGVYNLRGRVVTAFNLCQFLNLSPRCETRGLQVVIDRKNSLYSFAIDEVLDVMQISSAECHLLPTSQDPLWQAVCEGIYKWNDGKLITILNIDKIFEHQQIDEKSGFA